MYLGFFLTFAISAEMVALDTLNSLATSAYGTHLNLTFSTMSIFSERLNEDLVLLLYLEAIPVGSINSFG